MVRLAVIKTGGKQYLVKEGEEIVVDRLNGEKNAKLRLEALATFESDKDALRLGSPVLKEQIEASLIDNIKGDKIRVARFKSKVRYRKIKGFRPNLSRIKIGKI